MNNRTRTSHRNSNSPIGALIALLRFVTVLFSVTSSMWLATEARLPSQTEHRIETLDAPTHAASTLVELTTRIEESLIEDRVDVEDSEDDAGTRPHFAQAIVGGSGSSAVPDESWFGRAAPVPFRLRAFAGRAPPAA
jgi:hypothetical protein